MMEVIPISTNVNTITKPDHWSERIQAFQESGLSRKDWCQQNEIPQSTFGYWIRKIKKLRNHRILVILYSQCCLQNRTFHITLRQEIILLQSFFRKISGLKLEQTVRFCCRLLCSRPWSTMIDFAESTTVYLAYGVTNLRKSYTGLAAIIQLKFHLDPYFRCMFSFCNRRRTLIKILQWDGSGFWFLMKRLDRDSFHWPDTPD